jgi:hypothetical protein
MGDPVVPRQDYPDPHHQSGLKIGVGSLDDWLAALLGRVKAKACEFLIGQRPFRFPFAQGPQYSQGPAWIAGGRVAKG